MRADITGYNQTGHIIKIEVEVSQNDLLHEKKWHTYLDLPISFL